MFYAPLKHRLYRILFIANFFSNFGTWMHAIGVQSLMAKLSPSPFMLSLIQVATTLPVFLFSIPSGILADTTSKPKLIFKAQVFMALIALLFAGLTFSNRINAWTLIALTFFLNVGITFNLPAWQGSVSQILPREEIKTAVSLNNLSFNLARTLGPALAGFFCVMFGSEFVFLMNAISFTGLIWIFFRWKEDAASPVLSVKTGWINGFRECLLQIKTSKLLRRILVRAFGYFFFATIVWSVLPFAVLKIFRFQEVQLGLMTGCIGLGAIANAFWTPFLRSKFSEDSLLQFSVFWVGLTLSSFYWFQSKLLLLFLLFGFGVSWSMTVSVLNGLLQYRFPPSIRSRVIAIYLVCSAGFQSLGSFLIGKIMGESSFYLACLAVGITVTIVCFALHFFKLPEGEN